MSDRLFGAFTVQSLSQKYSCSLLTQITSTSVTILHPQEGRIAIVTDVGRGMRWTRRRCKTNGVFLRTAKSCGPDAPMLASRSQGVIRENDGGNKGRSPRRARRKPLKPLRGECRIDLAEPVVTCSCAYFTFARETAGAAGTRHSLRPLFPWANGLGTARAHRAARMRGHVCSAV